MLDRQVFPSAGDRHAGNDRSQAQIARARRVQLEETLRHHADRDLARDEPGQRVRVMMNQVGGGYIKHPERLPGLAQP